MRALLLLAIVACTPSHDGDPCQTDGDCGDEVCARTDVCAAADTLRGVHVTWTIGGVAPTASACASYEPLQLGFDDRTTGQEIAFAPVPCLAGLFSIDKLPTTMDEVFIGPETGSISTRGAITSDGTANLNLP
jgi:hypothetical protein